MELHALIQSLARPDAYGYPVDQIDIIQTHISVVALAGPYVYKVKKPVSLGFLDYGTLENRRHYCEEEVRLNRRLAPAVYLGVVPIVATSSGVRVEGEGEPIEWAVKMRRLPPEATFRTLLEQGRLTRDDARIVGEKVAAFHAQAETNQHICEFGKWEVIAGNARENFAQTKAHVGLTVSAEVFERLRELTEAELARLRPLIEARAARGVPRDTHGDLRLEHVYRLDPAKPADLALIDCIEFNERFRFADPVSDMAFLAMDLKFRGRADLADAFAEAYFEASHDEEGRELFPFYVAYRSVIRAKVNGIKAAEAEVSDEDRQTATGRSRAHWLLALTELAPPNQRPCLILISGLPGTGKSTLARGLAEHLRGAAQDAGTAAPSSETRRASASSAAHGVPRSGPLAARVRLKNVNVEVIRSDQVRKQLANNSSAKADLYSTEWSQETYAECLQRARAIIERGGRVLVDANFRRNEQRTTFLDAAIEWGTPAVLLICDASEQTIRARLTNRTQDVSDADWDIYQQLASEWEEPPSTMERFVHRIDANQPPEDVLRQAMRALRSARLVDRI